MFTTISQPTRQAARHTLRNMKRNGKQASIIDRGQMFTGSARWGVLVDAQVKRSHKGKVISKAQVNNIGFDIRKVNTGVKGYDLFYNGEFLIRRDTKIDLYQAGLTLAHKAKLDVTTLNYK